MAVLIKAKPNWREIVSPVPYCRAFMWGDLKVFAGKEPPGWHMSISHPYRYPTWEEIKAARYDLIPDDVTMAMLLPPGASIRKPSPELFSLASDSERARLNLGG